MPNRYITQSHLPMSGEPCFAGTRVPVKSLFDYLEAGDSLDEFLDQFPTVTHDMAVNVIAIAEKISAMETADFFERRSAAASKAKADKAWAKVSNSNPVPEDRWTAD
jgi:uncharacterized protein (DUF433 family)